MSVQAPKPVKVLQLKDGSPEVEILRENLDQISENLKASGANVVSIISVMGAYRTGKSFLLDLMLRYLRRREVEAKAAEEREAAEASQKTVGDEDDAEESAEHRQQQNSAAKQGEAPSSDPSWKLGSDESREAPEWMLEGDEARISEGSKTDDKDSGFEWRPGKDRCTQGIWLWSHPFVFKDQAGRKVAVVLMDTQGAYDDKMAKAQSSTIFGLTALLSSKLVYNIQNRVEEDKLENLDYFTTFAQTVTGELPGGNAPFGHLELLVRDWANYEDGFSLDQCFEQMREHQADHLDPSHVPEDAVPRVERLSSTFRNISSFGLPHPGLKVTKPQYSGEIAHINSDFVFLLDAFLRNFFGQDFPRPSAPLGMEITVGSFEQVVMNFAEVFKENAQEMAIGLREAFVKVEMMTAREDLLKRFKESLARAAPESAVIDPSKLQRDVEKLVESHKSEFENKLKPWRLKDSEEHSAVEDFTFTIREFGKMRLSQNEQQVEGATMKLVASPVVGGGLYIASVHPYLCYIMMAGGAYFHAKKWADRNEVQMLDPSVAAGMIDDAKKWGVQRYKDVQAMQVALNRCTPDEAASTLTTAAKQAGAMVAGAATSMGASAGVVSDGKGGGAAGSANGVAKP